MKRLAVSEEVRTAVEAHMKRVEPDEGAAFLLVRAARTSSGTRFVAMTPRFPAEGELEFSGPAVLKPGTQLISKMVSWALEEEAGLLFLHSHPNPLFPAGFSDVDRTALGELGKVMLDLIDGPFVAGVVSPTGWSAEVLSAHRQWQRIERITSTGRCVRILSPVATRPDDRDVDDRQIRAVGDISAAIRGTDAVLVGAGGLGSPLGETLTRMGVRSLATVDYELVDTPSNLRRVFGATWSDFESSRPKAEVVAEHCASLRLGTSASGHVADCRESNTLALLLDADVVFCGTDSHSSRAVLNAISYAFCIPVIDCGVIPGLRQDGGLECLAGQVRIVGPGLPCLLCLGTLDPDEIRLENAGIDEAAALRREGYGTGSPEVVPSIAALTVAGAGQMACAFVGLLDVQGDHRPSAWSFDPLNGTGAPIEKPRMESCFCHELEGSCNPLRLGLR